MWRGLERTVPKFKEYQWKAVSIVASTFQNVLFLDADCFPVRNPDRIIAPGSEPFASTGLVTWPDFWTSRVSPLFYRIAGDIEVPSLTSRPSSESGMLVYDKARHADTLLLAAYYSYNGPKHYYPMLVQHGAGEGDRDTFLQAALVLKALQRKGAYQLPAGWSEAGIGMKKGYWDVKKMPTVHGRTAKGKWRGMTMLQADPMDDYRFIMAAVEEAAIRDKDGGTTVADAAQLESKNSSSALLPRPSPSDSRSVEQETFLTDPSLLASIANLTLDDDDRRVMFFHENGVKLDLTRIFDPKKQIAETDEAGRYVRLWGDPGWIIELTGHDLEKLFWQESIKVYCQGELIRQFRHLEKVCTILWEIYGQAYL